MSDKHVKKYTFIEVEESETTCEKCALNGKRLCAAIDCEGGYLIITPGWKPDSVRVRELIIDSDDDGKFVSFLDVNKLADELAEEEKDQ